MAPRAAVRRSRRLRAAETAACRSPEALRTPGTARRASSRSPLRRGALPPAGQRGSEGMTVSELPDWLNPTGLEPAA